MGGIATNRPIGRIRGKDEVSGSRKPKKEVASSMGQHDVNNSQ